ncbi:MAG: hypothetical protein RR531_11015 [Longicatena sp.]
MNAETISNYEHFTQKLALIRFFYKDVHMSFKGISIILDSREEIIELYCKRLLNQEMNR